MLQLNSVKERCIFLSPTVQAGKEREPTINDFKILGGLGAGAFGKVYKAEHKVSKIIYALKQISKQQLKQQKMVNQIKIEVKIMYSLFHANVIKIFNHFEENDFIYLIIEFAEGGQLWDKLNRKGRFDEKTVQQYMREMVAAIEYCHSRDPPIIHRDIKPENILLDKEGHIKLADFGWSNFFNPNAKRKTYCGTLDYLAPEMIEESGHDVSLDYWSLGVLTYELLTGKAPFTPPPGLKDQKQIQAQLEQNILKGKIDFPRDFPPLAKDLVTKVLKRNPKQRATIDEIREHPWLKVAGAPGAKPEAKSPSKPNFFANLLGGNKTSDPNKTQDTELKKIETTSPAASADTSSVMNASQVSSQSSGSDKTLDTSTVSQAASNVSAQTQPKQPEENKSKEIPAIPAHAGDKTSFAMEIQEDGWTDRELNEYAARPQSIMHKPAAENQPATPQKANGMETSKSEDLFQRFSVSYNKKDEEKQEVVQELNKTVKGLRNEISELEVKLKLRDKEIEDIKKDYEKMKNDFSPNMGTPEGKRIMMLEEEKQKLKKEIDDIWQTVETKEAELQKKNLELKKMEETKVLAEKYKNEKSTLSKQLKEATTKLNQANAKIMELQQEKEDERQKYEKMLKENESKGSDRFQTNDQQKLRELVEFAKTAMDEMQAKINYYKEKSDSIEKMEKELNDKRIRIVKLEAEFEEKLNQTKRQIELEYEDKIARLKEEYKADIDKVENRNKELIKNLEQEIGSYKGLKFDKEETEAKIETYKLEIKSLKTNYETLNGLCANLQTLKEDNEKNINKLKCELEDLKIKNEMLKKSYSKSTK